MPLNTLRRPRPRPLPAALAASHPAQWRSLPGTISRAYHYLAEVGYRREAKQIIVDVWHHDPVVALEELRLFMLRRHEFGDEDFSLDVIARFDR